MLDELPGGRIALQAEHLRQPRRDDLGLVRVHSRRRDQVDGLLAGIDVELARLGQALPHVLDPVAIARIQDEDAPLGEMDDVLFLVDRGDRQVRFGPAVGDDRLAVGGRRPGLHVVAGVAELVRAVEPIVVLLLVAQADDLQRALLWPAGAGQPLAVEPQFTEGRGPPFSGILAIHASRPLTVVFVQPVIRSPPLSVGCSSW